MLIKQTDETIREFDINRVLTSLQEETNLTKDEAWNITYKTSKYINSLNLKRIESGFVRDIAYQLMLEEGFNGKKINRYAPIYIPLSELIAIDNFKSELTNDNANIGNSPESIHKRKADFVAKQQNLRMFPDYIETAHRTGDIHIHDLEYFRNRDFCADYDLRHPFYHGVSIDGGGLTSAICGPANNADVAILHAIKIIGAGQVNSAGGQGFYNFLTFLAPYFKDLTDKQIEQSLQMFIYECNTMLVARGGQAVFSSVQLTPGVPALWWDKPCVWKGKVDEELTYGELNDTVKRMFVAFMDIMIKGDYKGRPFSFPKPEVVMKEEFLINDNESRELYKKAVELSIKFGSTYYDNEYSPKRRQQQGISCYQCCLPASCLIPIEVNNGIKLKSIKDINIYNKLISENGLNNFEDILILDFDGEINKITVNGGRNIKCTDDHKIPIVRNGKELLINASDIKVKDEIKSLTTLPLKNQIPVFNNAIVNNEEYNRKLSYFLGLYAAEGSTNTSANKYIVLSFSSKEENMVNKTISLIKDLFNYDAKTYLINNDKGIDVRIYNEEIYNWFVNNNISLKGYEMTVPPFIFTTNNECKFAFLHGYYRGDGCLRKNGRMSKKRIVEINTISQELAEGVVLLLTTLGYHIRIGKYKDKRENRKERNIIYLSRQNEIKNFFACIKQNDITKVSVKKIEKINYTGKVYDPINVRNGHLFSTGTGLIISNCAYNFTIDPSKDLNFEDKMYFKTGVGFSMGASQVITLNIPRLALRSKDYKDLQEKTKKLINDIVIPIFKIRDKLRPTFYRPFFDYPKGKPIFDVNNLSYVIGTCGINELCEIIDGKNITKSKIGLKYNKWLNDYVNTLSYENQFVGGAKIALSRTPAETTCSRFAKLDLAKYGNEIKPFIKGDLESGAIYYSNGSMIPPEFETDLIQKVEIEGEYFKHLSGGNMTHIFMGESNPNIDGLTEFVLKLCDSDIDYFAISRDLTLCRDCKNIQYLITSSCNKCESQNVFSLARVTGYIQAIDGWNEGKLEELKQRKRHNL